jgi:hypothetical protein
LSEPEAEGAEAAGDEIAGVGLELDGFRFTGWEALETGDKALAVAKGDMVFSVGTDDIGPEACGIIFSGEVREVEQSTPEVRVFEGEDFPEAPEGSLCRLQGEERRTGRDGAAAYQPEPG